MKVDPDGAGLDERRLERITEHLQHRYIDAGQIAGCQVAVARRGHVGYFRSFGFRDLERSLPVDEDTIWRIYSMTKPVTGVALMTLYERGTFQLSDPVTRFIPEWRDLKVRERAEDGSERLVDPERPMTVRDLLMHMSGLGFAGRPTLPNSSRPTTSAKAGDVPGLPARARTPRCARSSERLPTTRWCFHPGRRWFYSMSTDMCGRLVEIISGQRFDDYLRTTIFGPLDMIDTAFMVPRVRRSSRFAANYRRTPNKKLALIDDPQRSGYRQPPLVPVRRRRSGLTTATDYLRFCADAAVRRRTGRRAHPRAQDGRVDDRQPPARRRGSHVVRNPRRLRRGRLRRHRLRSDHGGRQAPTATQVIGSPATTCGAVRRRRSSGWIPKEDLAVVFMTQLLPSGTFNFRGQLKTLVYPAITD